MIDVSTVKLQHAIVRINKLEYHINDTYNSEMLQNYFHRPDCSLYLNILQESEDAARCDISRLSGRKSCLVVKKEKVRNVKFKGQEMEERLHTEILPNMCRKRVRPNEQLERENSRITNNQSNKQSNSNYTPYPKEREIVLKVKNQSFSSIESFENGVLKELNLLRPRRNPTFEVEKDLRHFQSRVYGGCF